MSIGLERFINAQNDQLPDIEAELRAGRKRSHWIWYVFPQIAGLGMSSTSKHYAIADIEEARAYLAHPVLSERLRRHTRLVTACSDSITSILGHPDDVKFRSSMTLFDQVSPQDVFADALQKHFHGERDASTLRLIGAEHG
jgi:uncharacterized protein (DUF1810 family)